MDLKMGKEYYQYSPLQLSIINSCIPLLKSTIQDMSIRHPARFANSEEQFVVVDLGTASGRNSISLFKTIIETVRAINADMKFAFYLNDLPVNNFTVAFLACQQELSHYGNIFFYASGSSFYNLLFAPNSVDLYVGFSALIWLSKIPCAHDSIFNVPTKETLQTSEGQQWAAHAEADWLTFLQMREKELKVNGVIVLSAFTSSDDFPDIQNVWLQTHRTMKKALVSALQQHGLEKFDSCPPVYLRQKLQYQKPFNDKQTSLKLSYCHESVINAEEYKAQSKEEQENEYLKRITAWFRVVSMDCMMADLIQKGADEQKTKKSLDDMFEVEFPKLKKELFENAIDKFMHSLIVIENHK